MKLYEFIFLILSIVSLIDYIITTIIIHQCKDLCNLFRNKNRSTNKKRVRNTYNSNYNSNFFIQICILRRNKTMSDEEKKAIEIVKEIKDIRGMRQDVDGEHEDLCALDTVIELIEKQQKEIEELKDKYSDEKIRNTVIKRYKEVIEKDYVSKDKIRKIRKNMYFM